MVDWSKYKNFSKWEFDCFHTGENKMHPEFMDMLQNIRFAFNRPMIVNSGYRHWTHPLEIMKDKPGEHTHGLAADIRVYGEWAKDLVKISLNYGIDRIGVSQAGPIHSRYIHIGMGAKLAGFPPGMWSY